MHSLAIFIAAYMFGFGACTAFCQIRCTMVTIPCCCFLSGSTVCMYAVTCRVSLINKSMHARRWIWQQLPAEAQERCYFFNSFFWKKLTEKNGGGGGNGSAGSAGSAEGTPRMSAAQANHERVKKWTKVSGSSSALCRTGMHATAHVLAQWYSFSIIVDGAIMQPHKS